MKKRQRKISLLVNCLLAWYAKNARDLPWRRTRNAYAIWVSEIMLQQTQVKTALPFWERWMRELPTIESVARAGPERIHKLWEGLGYYSRVRNLQRAARLIVEKHEGKFPNRFEEILALPGIGRYTAGAIASIAFDQPTPILDGNVMRVLTRIFGIAGNPRQPRTNRRLWEIAGELVSRSAAEHRHGKSPTLACSRLNQSLMELGALVCAPRNPRCGECPAKKICLAFEENRVGDLPQLEKRGKAMARTFLALVMERDGRFLVRRRPHGVVNANLWEFPNVEISNPVGNGLGKTNFRHLPASAAKALGIELHNANPICSVKHTITRYRMTLQAFEVWPRRMPRIVGGVWLPRRRLDLLPFASAHRKVLAALKAQRLRSG